MSLRVGIAGRRGGNFIHGLRSVNGVEVAAICDAHAPTLAEQLTEHNVAQGYTNFVDMLENVDAVAVGTPMQYHVPHAIAALNAGKHVLSEVTAAVSLTECWQLLDAVQQSGATYMMAENYCYFEDNILVREMARKGVFGELYFGEGEYIHDVRFLHHNADGSPTWRYYWQVGQNGNTYITHELGPLMQWFTAADPNEKIASVTCLGSGRHTDPEHPHDDTSITLVKLNSGKLMKLRLDMMSNTPGMNFYSLQGVLGTFESGRGGTHGARIWVGENKTVSWNDPQREWKPVSEFREHIPQDWREPIEKARTAGHGGGDYHVARLFAESILNGATPDVDVYAALEWTAAGLCSQISIEAGGASIPVPNFRDRSQRPVTLDAPKVVV